MLRALVAVAAFAVWSAASGCSKPPRETLQLDRGILTVTNDTRENWSSVEIWLNQQFRVTVPEIAAGSRFQVPLGSFVEGFGRRFDFSRMQVTDLRLNARTADGSPVEIKKQFQKSGLAGALGGKQ
jgi:hypothetical protein